MIQNPIDSEGLPGARGAHAAAWIRGLTLWGFTLLLASAAGAMPAPGDADPADSTVTSQTGAATDRIPIEVPPGPGGLAPQLALTYSSRTGDGPFGVGWSLGIPEIRCSGRFGVQDFANCQRYELGDTLLVKNPGSPAYHTVVESFQRILPVVSDTGSPDIWTVEQPDGTKLVFGGVATISQDGATARWLIRRIEDAFLNQIFFEYDTTTDAGTAYPLSITYGPGSTPGAGPRRIEFVYENRPDPRLVFSEGLRRKLTRRVREIRVFGHEQIARRYVLEYAATSAYTTGRSRLAWVQEFGTDCTDLGEDPVGNCTGLPRRTFQYRDANDVPSGSGATAQWTGQPGYRVPFGSYSNPYFPSKQSYPQLIGDINGDGLPDRLSLLDSGCSIGTASSPACVGSSWVEVWINTGNGFTKSGAVATAYQNSFNTLQYSKPGLRYHQIPATVSLSLPPYSPDWNQGDSNQGIERTIYAMCYQPNDPPQRTLRDVYLWEDWRPRGVSADTSTLAQLRASAGAPSLGHFEPRPSFKLVDLDADGLSDLVLSARLGGVKWHFNCDDPTTPLATPGEVPPITVTVVFRNTGSGWENDEAAQELAAGLPPFEEVIVKSSYQAELDEPSVRLHSWHGSARSPCANNGYLGFEQLEDFSPEADEYKTAVCHNLIDLSPQFADFNGDGYLDLAVLQRDDPARFWTGSGWWLVPEGSAAPVNPARALVWIQTPNAPSAAQRWQPAAQYDLPDGFAHVGLEHGWDAANLVLGGSGCSSTWETFRECGPTTYIVDNGVRLADLNGDGLTDVVRKSTISDNPDEGAVLLNTGRGWCASEPGSACPEAARFILPRPIRLHYGPWGRKLGWPTGFFADLNGDRLLDFVWVFLPLFNRPFPAPETESWIHDPAASGRVWKHDARFDFPQLIPAAAIPHPVFPWSSSVVSDR